MRHIPTSNLAFDTALNPERTYRIFLCLGSAHFSCGWRHSRAGRPAPHHRRRPAAAGTRAPPAPLWSPHSAPAGRAAARNLPPQGRSRRGRARLPARCLRRLRPQPRSGRHHHRLPQLLRPGCDEEARRYSKLRAPDALTLIRCQAQAQRPVCCRQHRRQMSDRPRQRPSLSVAPSRPQLALPQVRPLVLQWLQRDRCCRRLCWLRRVRPLTSLHPSCASGRVR